MAANSNPLDPRYSARFFISPDGKAKGPAILELPLPEQFNIDASSAWEPFTAEGLLGLINTVGLGTLGGAAVKFSNNNMYIAELSHMWWRSTQPISFNLDFHLVAQNNAKTDVMDKIELLTSLVLPKANQKGVIGKGTKALGLTLLSSPPRDISLYLGGQIRFGAIVVSQVSTTFDTKCDEDGNFISANVQVSIMTSYTPNANTFKFQGTDAPQNYGDSKLAQDSKNKVVSGASTLAGQLL